MSTVARLLNAIQRDLPYSYRLPLGGAPSAVLCLWREINGLELLLTRRTDSVETHKGHYAFPGGMRDEADIREGDWAEETALREYEEEMGASREAVNVVGRLPALSTLSGFEIHPVVGLINRPDEDYRVNPHEIAEYFWVPIRELIAPGVYRQEWFDVRGLRVATDVYQLGERRIWGATAALIRNLLERLEER